MTYYDRERLPDINDKRIWNCTRELLSALSNTKEGLQDYDFHSSEVHPIDQSNVETFIQAVLQNIVGNQKLVEDRYEELFDTLQDVDDLFRSRQVTSALVDEVITRIRGLKLFSEEPLDQELPKRMEYTQEELRRSGEDL